MPSCSKFIPPTGVTLVDGPGLVIPSLKMDKSEMVLSGILPIDNLTQTVPCIERLLETRITFNTLVSHYGILTSCLSKGFKVSFPACKQNSKKNEYNLNITRKNKCQYPN